MIKIHRLRLVLLFLAIMSSSFFAAYADDVVNFYVHGELADTQTIQEDGHVTGYIPNDDCEYKHFVGWSETNQTSVIQTSPEDLFTNFKKKNFSKNTDLYAIYASFNKEDWDGSSTNQQTMIEDADNLDFISDGLYRGMYSKYLMENVSITYLDPLYNLTKVFRAKTQKISIPGLEPIIQTATITTDRKIYGLTEVDVLFYKTSNKLTLKIQVSEDGEIWKDVTSGNTSISSDDGTLTLSAKLEAYGDYYVRIEVSSNTENSVDITQIIFQRALCYSYSNYSTDCNTASYITQFDVNGNETVSLSNYHVDANTMITVQAGGCVKADQPTTIKSLTIEKVNGQSSQVLQAENLTVSDNVYFDVNINATAMTWYDIAVPFVVDRLTGLSLPDGSNIPLNDVLVYNAATRAAQGANGSAWEYQDNGYLVPGKGYYIMFASPVETIRFTKKTDEKLNNEKELVVSEFTSNNHTDANWNLVANNSLRYVNLGFTDTENNGNLLAQTYNPSTDSYVACAQNETTYCVGTPFFVQIAKADHIVWNTDETHSILRAPTMTTNRVERFTVELSANGEMKDRLFVSADEDARNEYQIGKDVAKMGVSSTIAQMWVDNYNTKLCANEAVLFNDQATFPLGVFVPKNGEYTLAITNAPDNAELYLTQDGQPIWNLSKGAYTTEWAKGTHNEYGLMLQVTDAKAPTNLNGLNCNENAVKLLKSSDIYILRNGQIYSTMGQLVK